MMSNKKFIIILILISLATGIFWCFKFAHDPGWSDDALGYDNNGRLIAEEGIFNGNKDGADRPLYPIFLGMIYKIFGHNYLAVRMAQILLFVLLTIIVYFLGRQFLVEKVARLWAMIVAIGYPTASFTGILMREMLFTFLLLLGIFLLYRAVKTKKLLIFFICGLVWGLAYLTNPVIQLFFLLIVINLFFSLKTISWRQRMGKIAILIGGIALIILPWFGYCHNNFGSAVSGSGLGLYLREKVERMSIIKKRFLPELLAAGVGDYFAIKLSPGFIADESKYGQETRRRVTTWFQSGMDFTQMDKILISEAVPQLLNQPLPLVEVLIVDFFKFNTPLAPNDRLQHTFVDTHPELSDWQKAIILLTIRFLFLIFFAIIIYAIVSQIKKWPILGWMILAILYFNIIYTVISGFARYAAPIYPFYYLFALLGMSLLYGKLKKRTPIFYKS